MPNRISNRETPALISFGERQRFIGEGAVNQRLSNAKNTLCWPKKLMATLPPGSDASSWARWIPVKQTRTPEGGAAVEVTLKGEAGVYGLEHVLGMHLGDVLALARARNAENDIAAEPVIVLAVPPTWTPRQCRAVSDAARIAGITQFRLLNESAAVTLYYARERLPLRIAQQVEAGVAVPDPFVLGVLFVDIGHSHTTASLVRFSKGRGAAEAVVLDVATADVGGGDFDIMLANKFLADIKSDKGIDVKGDRALLRLLLQARPRSPCSFPSPCQASRWQRAPCLRSAVPAPTTPLSHLAGGAHQEDAECEHGLDGDRRGASGARLALRWRVCNGGAGACARSCAAVPCASCALPHWR